MKRLFHDNSLTGFTLIELLIVVAIIAVLGAILFTSLGQDTISSARETRRISDLKAMENALELYAIDNDGFYPPDVAGLVVLIPDYIPVLPADPLHNLPGGCDSNFNKDERFPSAVSDNGDYGYRYVASGDRLSYVLQVCLKYDNSKNKALDIDCDNATLTPPCFDSSAARMYDIHS